jgi:hypothetical protein
MPEFRRWFHRGFRIAETCLAHRAVVNREDATKLEDLPLWSWSPRGALMEDGNPNLTPALSAYHSWLEEFDDGEERRGGHGSEACR